MNMVNSLLSLSKHSLFVFLHLAGYRILGWTLFSLSNLKVFFHCLLVYVEKSIAFYTVSFLSNMYFLCDCGFTRIWFALDNPDSTCYPCITVNNRDTKGTFHAKMGSIKDRNGTDLTEAEDIKKRWQEYNKVPEFWISKWIFLKALYKILRNFF